MEDYVQVKYNGKLYCVCRYFKNPVKAEQEEHLFVIDAKDFERVSNMSEKWHAMGNYVGCYENHENDKGRDTIYLHNFIKEIPPGGGKGQTITIDHVNRITHDNRRSNLRLITQSQQNDNQTKRKRKLEILEAYGISPAEIPTGVWLQKDRSRFVIEIYKDKELILYTIGTGAQKYTFRDKLEQVKIILKMFCEKPENKEKIAGKQLIENFSDEFINLRKEFNDILDLSGYKCTEKNKFEIPEKNVIKIEMNKLGPYGKELIDYTINNIDKYIGEKKSNSSGSKSDKKSSNSKSKISSNSKTNRNSSNSKTNRNSSNNKPKNSTNNKSNKNTSNSKSDKNSSNSKSNKKSSNSKSNRNSSNSKSDSKPNKKSSNSKSNRNSSNSKSDSKFNRNSSNSKSNRNTSNSKSNRNLPNNKTNRKITRTNSLTSRKLVLEE